MEGDISEQDYDEFEMLLGEIPNATSGTHLSRQTSLSIPSQDLDTVSIGHEKEFYSSNKVVSLSTPSNKASELYNSPQPATNRGNFSSNRGASFSKCPEYQKLQRKVSAYEFEDNSNLPNEKSLTLLLEEMGIKENPASKASSPASVMNKHSPLNHTFLQNEQYLNHQNNSLLGHDPVDMNFPPSRTLNGVTSSSIELESQSPLMRKK